MSNGDDVLLGRAELERAFTALGERLARRGGRIRSGRLRMALAYDATRATRDVDARFVPHGIVTDEARHDDLRVLADIIGVQSADQALQICAEFYPDEEISQRSAAVLRELFS